MAYYKNKLKKLLVLPLLCAGFLFSTNLVAAYASMPTYYNAVSSQTLTKGLVYEKSQRITANGMLDVHVLKVALDNPNLSISTIKSKTEYGLKETTAKLAADNGALAAVNGDFFGVAGLYSIPIGVEVANNEILSIGEASNISGNANATFFIDINNSPFIDYMHTELHFMNDGVESLKVAAINKIYDLAVPAFITREAMETTATLDTRINGSAKIVVRNGVITYISQKNETVEIPEDGYIVAMNWAMADANLHRFKVGQKAEMIVRPSLDLSGVQNAITGAGKILSNGAIANDGGYVASGRQPRTAVGISKDKKQMILMVVDGRTHSIGATQNDMAALMLEYGAYEAMHLDGGGSSSMVAKTMGEDSVRVLNTVSDGSQRRVINALGIFNNAPKGDLSLLQIDTSSDLVLKNSYIDLDIYGLDAYYNKLDLDSSQISYSVANNAGTFMQNKFIPHQTGLIEISAIFNGIVGTKTIEAVELAQLSPAIEEINTQANGKTTLSFNGISKDGQSFRVSADAVQYEVFPSDLGKVSSDGVFQCDRMGIGWIKCTSGDIVSYISVHATLYPKMVYDFEYASSINAISYPDNFVTTTTYTADKVVTGNRSIELKYDFMATSDTQAAYVEFAPALPIGNKAYALRLSVYGDNSGHWLRAKITDANNKAYTLDFARNIDWEGWNEVEAAIPSSVVYPISVERIYVASLNQPEAKTHTIYLDDLKGLFENNDIGELAIPPSSVYVDPLKYDVNFKPVSTGDIAFMPAANVSNEHKPQNYDQLKQVAVNALVSLGASAPTNGVYFSNESLKDANGKPIKYHIGAYNIEVVNNTLLMAINTSKGGIVQTDASQWANIKKDISQTSAKNVILFTDIKPSGFKYSQEYQMLHNLLKEMRSIGKTIFVVSNQGTENDETIKDGIRYLNVGKMFDWQGKLNADYSILRFKTNGDTIQYAFEKVQF